jgi:hypothetical protein
MLVGLGTRIRGIHNETSPFHLLAGPCLAFYSLLDSSGKCHRDDQGKADKALLKGCSSVFSGEDGLSTPDRILFSILPAPSQAIRRTEDVQQHLLAIPLNALMVIFDTHSIFDNDDQGCSLPRRIPLVPLILYRPSGEIYRTG